MALNFPNSPTLNQIYSDPTSGFSYKWNGSVWISFSPTNVSNIREVDNISSSFNGSTTSFPLTVSGSSISPENPQQLLVSLGGIIQNPNQDYSISGSNILFSTAPASGLTFFGIYLGISLPLGQISDNTVSPSSLTTGGPQWTSNGNVVVSGILTASSFVGDGSGLTNVSGAGGSGLGTALTSNTNTATDYIYYTNEILSVNSTVTVDSPSLVAYTQYPDLAVNSGADFIVADGTDFFSDAIGLGTVGTFKELYGAGGRVRADIYTNKAGTGAPSFPSGLSAVGVVTSSNGFSSGTGSPVKISVSGTNLTFTVTGVGSTTLKLF